MLEMVLQVVPAVDLQAEIPISLIRAPLWLKAEPEVQQFPVEIPVMVVQVVPVLQVLEQPNSQEVQVVQEETTVMVRVAPEDNLQEQLQ